MSAIEDGAMQDKAANVDDLVKRLRAGDICYMNRAAAELTRLRERNAELLNICAKADEAIAGLLATPEIADADPRDKDEETQIAERKARAAIRSLKRLT
jgi:hypothetical protein